MSMDTGSLLKQFNIPGLTGEKADIPTAEGFKPTGFVGPVMAQYIYNVLSNEDLFGEAYAEHEFAKKGGRTTVGNSGWFNYYFRKPEDGTEAMKAINSKFNTPTQVWHFESKVDQIISMKEESKAKWTSGVVSGDIKVTTLRSKYAYEYHLIALPMAVQAAANLLGFKVEHPFTLDELMNIRDEQEAEVLTDEFHKQMIGDPDRHDDMYESALWLRRAALWADLGESDPRKYTVNKPDPKTDTTSEKLAACLAFATTNWSAPIWLRLQTVKSPNMNDKNKEGKALSLYVIGEIFKGEAHAKEVWAKELAEIQARQAASEQKPTGGEPVIPSTWASLGRDTFVTEMKKRLDVPPVLGAQQMGMDVTDFEAWTKFLRG